MRLSTAGEVLVSRTCSFFASPGCTGAEITTIARHTLLADTSGGWSLLDGVLAAPPAAASLLCSVDVAKSGEPVAARLDQVRLEGANFFADGFESGDTSAWSSTTP